MRAVTLFGADQLPASDARCPLRSLPALPTSPVLAAARTPDSHSPSCHHLDCLVLLAAGSETHRQARCRQSAVHRRHPAQSQPQARRQGAAPSECTRWITRFVVEFAGRVQTSNVKSLDVCSAPSAPSRPVFVWSRF
eukprot:2570998-Pleurochrysis_carterae.AAC.7